MHRCAESSRKSGHFVTFLLKSFGQFLSTIEACKKGTKNAKICDKIAKIGQNFAFSVQKRAPA